MDSDPHGAPVHGPCGIIIATEAVVCGEFVGNFGVPPNLVTLWIQVAALNALRVQIWGLKYLLRRYLDPQGISKMAKFFNLHMKNNNNNNPKPTSNKLEPDFLLQKTTLKIYSKRLFMPFFGAESRIWHYSKRIQQEYSILPGFLLLFFHGRKNRRKTHLIFQGD